MVTWIWSRPSAYQWLPVPASTPGSPATWSGPAKGTSRRRRCILLAALPLGPPDWTALREWQAALPQHDLELPFPEGRTGRYVKFSNEARMLGWNNCFNEELMNAYLAHSSRRAYVFSPYIWAPEHYPWPPEQHRPGEETFILTPLPALIGGPCQAAPGPRVCPSSERRVIRTPEVKPALADKDGAEVFARWVEVLGGAEELCIEVVPPEYGSGEDSFPQTFDLGLWGSKRIVSLWDGFSKSPVSRLLGPSPIVASALVRNEYLFGAAIDDPLAGTLAVHLRRGDYVTHCANLAGWGSGFYSWAQLPFLLDKFDPTHDGSDAGKEAKRVDMMRRCLPTVEELVARIGAVRNDYYANATSSSSIEPPSAADKRVPTPKASKLDTLYLLTNEPPRSAYLVSLTAALKKDGWRKIINGGDREERMRLDAEQTEVGGAVDMEVGRRAGVFLGNGWSSFTSNIIHQRLVDGRAPVSVRLL
ncbi:hypothetical protein B0H17DRAFT_1170164 [Mycena rosella]|uniref:Uncharacterized protein n=1 Tax=Mycena rosella TaxID=1033263 RepID=A0AAD7D6D2_MYCRO|nr:hypothetical protein B0H17DRAFT_1170164 [Mycena rosella]